jgi:hypothetical protein
MIRHGGLHAVVLAAAGLLAVLGPLLGAPPTLAQSAAAPTAAPTTCRVGTYLRALHAFHPAADTFAADL